MGGYRIKGAQSVFFLRLFLKTQWPIAFSILPLCRQVLQTIEKVGRQKKTEQCCSKLLQVIEFHQFYLLLVHMLMRVNCDPLDHVGNRTLHKRNFSQLHD